MGKEDSKRSMEKVIRDEAKVDDGIGRGRRGKGGRGVDLSKVSRSVERRGGHARCKHDLERRNE